MDKENRLSTRLKLSVSFIVAALVLVFVAPLDNTVIAVTVLTLALIGVVLSMTTLKYIFYG